LSISHEMAILTAISTFSDDWILLSARAKRLADVYCHLHGATARRALCEKEKASGCREEKAMEISAEAAASIVWGSAWSCNSSDGLTNLC